ncbi:MAG TPA: hypothetical protein VMW69_00265 [Spirochaetia bacterium]|nr:hypothetical protein [Spirochaetia bacterium]
MKALLSLRLGGLVVGSLLVMGCNIIPLAPSVALDVQTTPYTSSTVEIPYSFATLSANSNSGNAECRYELSKWRPGSGGYESVTSNSSTMANNGTLTFDLSNILGSQTGSSDVDGLYSLSFVVYTGLKDSNGNPIPVPYLSVSKNFSVHTYSGPEIFTLDPPILNVNGGPQSVTASGLEFSTTSTLMTLPASAVLSGSTFVSAEKMQATIDPTTLSAGSQLSIYVSDSQGSASPIYNIPIVGDVTVAAVAPSGDSMRNSHLPLYIGGSFLGPWTKVTITDSAGNTAALAVQQSTGSYIFGYIDLTPLVAGAATLTAANPDGTSATYPFTVYN